jgi:hypothetical protein
MFMGDEDSLKLCWMGACLPQAFDEDVARQACVDEQPGAAPGSCFYQQGVAAASTC